jgi:hypothetical protein
MSAWQPIQTADTLLGEKVWVFDPRAGVVLARYDLIPGEQQPLQDSRAGSIGWRAIEFPSGELRPKCWTEYKRGGPPPDWPQI